MEYVGFKVIVMVVPDAVARTLEAKLVGRAPELIPVKAPLAYTNAIEP